METYEWINGNYSLLPQVSLCKDTQLLHGFNECLVLTPCRKFTDNHRTIPFVQREHLKNCVTMQWEIYHFETRGSGGGGEGREGKRIERWARNITISKVYAAGKFLNFVLTFDFPLQYQTAERDVKCIDIRMTRGLWHDMLRKTFVTQKLPLLRITRMKPQLRTQRCM